MQKIKPFIFPICVFGFLILFRCFFIIYQVSGESMEPTLYNKQFGLAVRTNISSVDRFDKVLVKQGKKTIVKRIIGMPGDTIEYRDGKLYINNELTEDPYANGNTNDFSITLGENEYYCLGDNREHSLDSRYYGPFNKKDIKAVLVGGK